MTQAAINFGRILYERNVPEEAVSEAEEAFENVPQLLAFFSSPVIPESKKHCVIDRVFAPEMRSFFKVALRHHKAGMVKDIFRAYHVYACEREGILEASFYYVTEPTEQQLFRIREHLKKKFGKNGINLNMVKEPSLIGGFIIRVGDVETDWSTKGRLSKLERLLARR